MQSLSRPSTQPARGPKNEARVRARPVFRPVRLGLPCRYVMPKIASGLRSKLRSKKPFSAPHGSERRYVGKRKGEPVLVFISNRSKSETPVFHIHAATVLVIGHLDGTVLHLSDFSIVS